MYRKCTFPDGMKSFDDTSSGNSEKGNLSLKRREELQAEVSLMAAQKECGGEECCYSSRYRDR